MCFLIPFFKRYINRNPQRFVEITHIPAVAFVLAATKFFLFAEMLYVVPQIIRTGSAMYFILWFVNLFVAYNIIANLFAAHYTDTSVGSLPKERQIPKPEEEHLWHFCDKCQKLVPPRSWHCKLCNVCILKRNHHCIFTASCIGHNNHRYFFWFTFYLALGNFIAMVMIFIAILKNKRSFLTYYASIYTEVFLLKRPANNPESLDNFLDLLYFLSIVAMAATGGSFVCQFMSTYVKSDFMSKYNRQYHLGIRNTFDLVLGKRGFWTFLSPNLNSTLQHDGASWKTNPGFKELDSKDLDSLV
ncbi:probable palmitoyltransferase ZDHHC24 [Drosophila bipectinata]|uniref:probable palmitoyltransferase ZDHHC24 n=1 Tax=Drosophila bipectinata TaxID=42026 RepID=UPI001C89C982|nr:probable palmitoyltransferase ZDHHC24 [Drosophila bipectinata]